MPELPNPGYWGGEHDGFEQVTRENVLNFGDLLKRFFPNVSREIDEILLFNSDNPAEDYQLLQHINNRCEQDLNLLSQAIDVNQEPNWDDTLEEVQHRDKVNQVYLDFGLRAMSRGALWASGVFASASLFSVLAAQDYEQATRSAEIAAFLSVVSISLNKD